MMTISANYEGTYANLMRFVHELDRSPRLLIIEGLNAAPQQTGGTLNISMKIDTFVRDDGSVQMSLIPSQFGAEPKKLAVLGGLAVVLIVVYLINRTPDVPQQAASITPQAARNPVPLESLGARARSVQSAAGLTPQAADTGAARRGQTAIQDFKPTLKLPDGVDVSRIDPALKLDLLAQLKNVPLEGGERSLFEFGAPPKPITPTPTVAKVVPITPPSSTPAIPATPPKPVIPPIPAQILRLRQRISRRRSGSRQTRVLPGRRRYCGGRRERPHPLNRFKDHPHWRDLGRGRRHHQ